MPCPLEPSMKDLNFSSRFSSNPKLYSFATENVAGYMAHFNRIRSVLTVTGSGDQAFHAILNGARDVTCFDCNQFASFWVELKLCAISNLSWIEFRNFFLRNSDSQLDYETYLRLKNNLTQNAKDFFNSLYINNCYSGSILRESNLFNLKFDIDTIKISTISYLKDEKKYHDLKSLLLLTSIDYILCDVNKVSKFIPKNKKFDLILLSNISDYICEMYPDSKSALQEFSNNVLNTLSNHLNPNGVLAAAYIYDIESKISRSEVDNPQLREKYFSKPDYLLNEIVVPSVIENKLDSLVTLISAN